jgi:ABC-type dipeptide/oligopeptide/nickel transport system ATPase component
VSDAPLLEIQDLRVRFTTSRGLVYAVNGVSFDVRPGETLGLVGESGCGKSVTALASMGILARSARITSGSIKLEGRELVGLSERAWRRIRGKEIAMIFQDPMTSLNPVLTVGAQLREAIDEHPISIARRRRGALSSCSTRSGSRAPQIACATTRINSRAACASA